MVFIQLTTEFQGLRIFVNLEKIESVVEELPRPNRPGNRTKIIMASGEAGYCDEDIDEVMKRISAGRDHL